jgi:hypothetical protein
MSQHMLTTIDNPYNPFTDFDEWNAFDILKGYHTLEYLARVVNTSEDLPTGIESMAIEQGIDDIVKLNPLGLYKKIPEPESSN